MAHDTFTPIGPNHNTAFAKPMSEMQARYGFSRCCRELCCSSMHVQPSNTERSDGSLVSYLAWHTSVVGLQDFARHPLTKSFLMA